MEYHVPTTKWQNPQCLVLNFILYLFVILRYGIINSKQKRKEEMHHVPLELLFYSQKTRQEI